jgi:diguanylate cyclase (GGDEF)-like protein
MGAGVSDIYNVLLLAGDAVLYFAVLAGLFRARAKLGLGAFFCALGVMHFLETYLASIFYVTLPAGIVTSPGSTVLFTGKLMLLLMVYIREDAVMVRQPIYGLLAGNLLLAGLALVIRHHDLVPLGAGRAADFAFLDEMGGLMLWGTAVLFVDCILIILLYERSRVWLGDRVLARLALSGAAVLTFDQLAFFVGLRAMTGAGLAVLVGGWIAKMGAVALYSLLVGIYLRWLERPRRKVASAPRISDVFDMLTYRERYEDLLARSGRDALTGVLDRGRLQTQGRGAIEDAIYAGRPISLLLIDLDHFKSFNDRFGHAAGDHELRRVACLIATTIRAGDLFFRFGGEGFVVIADGLSATPAMALGERIRRELATSTSSGASAITASIGIASCGEDAGDYDALFAIADKRLYEAKASGRNCVVGRRAAVAAEPAGALAPAM